MRLCDKQVALAFGIFFSFLYFSEKHGHILDILCFFTAEDFHRKFLETVFLDCEERCAGRPCKHISTSFLTATEPRQSLARRAQNLPSNWMYLKMLQPLHWLSAVGLGLSIRNHLGPFLKYKNKLKIPGPSLCLYWRLGQGKDLGAQGDLLLSSKFLRCF